MLRSDGVYKGNTMLHFAVTPQFSNKHRKEIVELLLTAPVSNLKAPLDLNIKNGNGKTCLDLAIETERTDIVELLKAHGATESSIVAAQNNLE